MTFKVRPSTLQDALELAPRLRTRDKEEVLAAGSSSPEEALVAGVETSDICLTVDDLEGNPQLMMGVGPSHDPLMGYVWMLSSDFLLTQRKALVRHTPEFLDLFHSRYPLLTNAVDARNKVHIHWLKRVGFSFINTLHDCGPHSLPFYSFVRLKHV